MQKNEFYFQIPLNFSILYDIIYGYGEELLERLGFNVQDIKTIMEDDMNVKFTNKKIRS